MERQLRLETDRLDLVPFSSEFIDVLADHVAAVNLIGASVPEGWPDAELSGLLKIYAPWVAEERARLGYGPWVVISRDDRSVVGSAGFMGTPKEDKAVELGFGTHPDFRNRGYAAEAAQALVKWALAQPSVERVVAKCDPDNAPSVRVLEKIGMTRIGEVDGELLWDISAAGRAS